MRNCFKGGPYLRFIKRTAAWMLAAFIFILPVKGQDSSSAVLNLPLATAIDSAVRNNVQTLIAGEKITEAEGMRGLTLSAILPNLSASAGQANLTANLAAQGMPVSEFKGFPVFVGPWSRFDARISLVQSIFDLGAIRRLQAGGDPCGNQCAGAIGAIESRPHIHPIRLAAGRESCKAGFRQARGSARGFKASSYPGIRCQIGASPDCAALCNDTASRIESFVHENLCGGNRRHHAQIR